MPAKWLYPPLDWLYPPGDWLYPPADWLYPSADWLYLPHVPLLKCEGSHLPFVECESFSSKSVDKLLAFSSHMWPLNLTVLPIDCDSLLPLNLSETAATSAKKNSVYARFFIKWGHLALFILIKLNRSDCLV